jgi:hypothetical protein
MYRAPSRSSARQLTASRLREILELHRDLATGQPLGEPGGAGGRRDRRDTWRADHTHLARPDWLTVPKNDREHVIGDPEHGAVRFGQPEEMQVTGVHVPLRRDGSVRQRERLCPLRAGGLERGIPDA